MAFIDLGDQFIALQKGRMQPADDGRHFARLIGPEVKLTIEQTPPGNLAIECLRKAFVVAPDYIDAMFNLALLLLRMRNRNAATEVIRYSRWQERRLNKPL